MGNTLKFITKKSTAILRTCPLKEYKDFLGVSAFDFISSIILACLITYSTDIPLVISTLGVLELGLLLNVLFGIETSAVKYLGLTCT